MYIQVHAHNTMFFIFKDILEIFLMTLSTAYEYVGFFFR